jgi:replicative DNA helicase
VISQAQQSNQPPPGQDAGLPVNLEAERAVLGFLLVGGAWLYNITARDFAAQKEQIIWQAMNAIHAAGEDIDRQRLAVELGEKKLKLVGLGYLADLGDGFFPEMRIDSYVTKVRNATLLRDILHHTKILETHVHSGDLTAEELIDMAEAAFAGMQTRHGNGRFTYVDVPSIWRWEANVSWVVAELVPEGAITLITGDSGHGKTIFATAMAGAIATGSPFLGRATIKRKVLYLDRENPAGVVKQHLHDLHIDETPDLTVWGSWCAAEPDGPDSKSLQKFAAVEKPVMIFDPAIAFHTGDEQSSTDTRAFMQHYRNLAAAGATVVLLHHVGKSENAKMYRGSSDYKAAVDVAYLLEKLGDPAGALSEAKLVPFKNRFGGSTTLPLSFQDGAFHASQRGETCQEIMERLVKDNPGESARSLVALGRAAGMSKHQAEDHLSRGVKVGRFEVRKAGRGHGYYLREGGLDGM